MVSRHGPRQTEKERVTADMVLAGQVPLESVKGRFDHFASGKGKLFVSGLGNNTVKVIDLFHGTRSHEITGVPNPQGVAFSPHWVVFQRTQSLPAAGPGVEATHIEVVPPPNWVAGCPRRGNSGGIALIRKRDGATDDA